MKTIYNLPNAITYYCQNKGCYKAVAMNVKTCTNCGVELDWKRVKEFEKDLNIHYASTRPAFPINFKEL